jgi:hypothetical protein
VGTTIIMYTITTYTITITALALHRRPLYHNPQFRLYIPTMAHAMRRRVTWSHRVYLHQK